MLPAATNDNKTEDDGAFTIISTHTLADFFPKVTHKVSICTKIIDDAATRSDTQAPQKAKKTEKRPNTRQSQARHERAKLDVDILLPLLQGLQRGILTRYFLPGGDV